MRISENERTDQKANQGTKSSQPGDFFILRRAKSLVSTYIYKYTAPAHKVKSLGKPWENLVNLGPFRRHLGKLQRAMTVLGFFNKPLMIMLWGSHMSTSGFPVSSSGNKSTENMSLPERPSTGWIIDKIKRAVHEDGLKTIEKVSQKTNV
ncbi:hypothetical protein TNCV_4672431 [Trichonephila clavipes]|nr:hypothetical protein TNCV_4672431 [Trichonephila clavipes]